MKNSSDFIEKRMSKFKKKSKSTNVLEIDPNDQHYKRYFSSIYGDELQQFRTNKRNKPTKKSSLSFQQVRSTSFKEDEINRKMNWKKLQLSRIKLKQTAKTSALFAGFAMVSSVIFLNAFERAALFTETLNFPEPFHYTLLNRDHSILLRFKGGLPDSCQSFYYAFTTSLLSLSLSVIR